MNVTKFRIFGVLVTILRVAVVRNFNVTIIRVFFIRGFNVIISRGLWLEICLNVLNALIASNFVSERKKTIIPKES